MEDSINASSERPIKRRRRRVPGTRTNQACVNCKTRKLKCDDQLPGCSNCQRSELACLIEDPVTKQQRPRDYLRSLEERLSLLETPEPCSATTVEVGPDPTDHSSVVDPPTSRSADTRITSTSDSLPERVGFLVVKTSHEEPQYLGSSSAFSFAHIINSSLSTAIPGTTSPEDVLSTDAETPPAPCPLPEYSLAKTLSNAYFENIHLQYPFLHEPTVRGFEELLLTSPEARSDVRSHGVQLFILNMVYSIGALLLPNQRRLAKRLYASAQMHPDILSRNNVEGIQGLLCHAMYSLRSREGLSIWRLSGLALRQCIELGYHRKPGRGNTPQSALQLEMRKRVFWVAQGIDCAYALRLGRPLGIQLFEIDAELPLDIDDAAISDAGLQGSSRTSSGQPPTSMSNAIHVIRLRQVWAQLKAAPGSQEDEREQHRIAQVRASLDEWLSSAPPCPPRPSARLSIFCTREWSEVNYSSTILQLYRGQLVEGKGTADSIFMDCVTAAATVCRLYRRLYIGTSITYTRPTLHCLFLAGLTYLHCLWTSPHVRASIPHSEVIKTCTDCTVVLVVIAEGWTVARAYRDMFEALVDRTMNMILNGKPEASATVEAEPRSELEPVDSLEHEGEGAGWLADLDSFGGIYGFDDLLASFMDDAGHFHSQDNFNWS